MPPVRRKNLDGFTGMTETADVKPVLHPTVETGGVARQRAILDAARRTNRLESFKAKFAMFTKQKQTLDKPR